MSKKMKTKAVFLVLYISKTLTRSCMVSTNIRNNREKIDRKKRDLSD